MSKFPEYLEEWLNVVELNIHLSRGTESSKVTMEGLRERIERYADERVNETSVEYLSKLGKLGAELDSAVYELNVLRASMKSEIDRGCEDLCNSHYGSGYKCDCYVGRLKAALKP